MAEACICTACQNAAGNVVGNFFGGIFTFISNPIILVRKCNNNVDNLKNTVAELKDEKENVENFAEAADRRGEQIALTLMNWLIRANNFIEAAEKLVADAEVNAKKECFFGLCLNPKSRYQLSKKAEENSKTIYKHVDEARGFNLPLFYIPAPPEEVAAPVKGFEDFHSRKDVLEKIMEALQSQKSSIIGVHGMPGMGKTMLAKEIKRKAEQDKLFDLVVMALVSRNADLKKIQVQIARGLGLDQLPNEITTEDAAERIKERLKKIMKVLIILDDIWRPGIDLEELGIPLRNEPKTIEGSSSREEYVDCKILLTSRDSDVLSDLMGSPQNFSLHQLEFEEAWELLKKIVGDRAESDEIHSTAIDIVQECGGLPLAITTMAKALKNKEPYEWRDALRKLRKPSLENFNGISANVYSAIEVSYSHLESEKLKKTFLLCCLMGHKGLIGDLLRYGVGLGLFANTMEEARDEVVTLISKLRASSLLIDDYDYNRFDMLDLIHDVAVSIACRDRLGLLLTGDHEPKEWSDVEAMKDFNWICLRYANIDGLVEELESPYLTFFWLGNKNPSLQIPASFFKGMQRLKVLDLTGMHMSFLPSSISLLKNLRTLCLDQSVLEDIRIIGELKNLEILSFLESDFEELPREIGQLTQLKLLDLSNCTKLKIIPPRVLASMSRLEELYLRNSFRGWEIEENENQRNASLAELMHLKKLTTLEVCIPDIQKIPKDLFFENLKRYMILIGDEWENLYSSFGSSRILKLHLHASASFNYLIKMLLKMAEELHLRKLVGVKNVVDELNTEGFQDLKYLYVHNAPEVQHIIKSTEGVLFYPFPSLEVLFLQNLINLEKIVVGRYKETAFNNLRMITVESCDKLKNLFSASMARQLLQLQGISVTNCGNMEEIVGDEKQGSRNDIVEATDQLKFAEALHFLRLECLPKLISVKRSCRGMQLFNEQVAFPNLEELQISWLNVYTIWHTSVTSHVGRLTKLIIKGCHNLKYLFSSSMVTILVKLKHLQIRECKRMTNVIFSEDVEENKNLIFPCLDFLLINYLYNLESFYSGNCFIEFPSLKQLQIMNCPKLEGFTVKSTRTNVVANIQPLFNEQVDHSQLGKHDSSSVLANLEALTVHFCESLISLSTSTVPFEALTTLEVSHCRRMINLVSISTAQSLGNLKSMIISYCHKLTEIVGNEGDGTQDLINFTELTDLKLEGLTKLASFCSGNSIFQFPSLERVIVNQCPQLKKFCRGELNTPVLKRVQLIAGVDKWRWTGSLNTTIQQMYIEKDGYAGLQNLILSDFPEVMESWHKMSPQEMLHFRLIQDLKICGNNFKYLLTPSIALAFVQLKKLEVINCATMEQVIVGEGPENQIIFPHLWLINLESCSGLTSFYMGSQNLRIPALLHIYVKDCPKIVTLAASTFLGEHEKEAFQHFFSSKVETPLLDTLDLCSINVQKMWHNELSSMSSLVQNLRKLTVRNCGNLKYLFTSSVVKSFVQLEVLEIFECQLMEVVILIEDWEDEERMRRVIFPKLDVLELMVLPQLIKFCGTCNSLEISEPQGLMNGGGSQVLSPTS